MTSDRWFQVVSSYRSEYADALVAQKGELLAFDRRPSEWPGWIWCTAASGKAAWVPESWMELSGDSCVLSRDYDSRELSVREGEALEVEFEESGWAWVRNSAGDCGWIPADRIEPERQDAV